MPRLGSALVIVALGLSAAAAFAQTPPQKPPAAAPQPTTTSAPAPAGTTPPPATPPEGAPAKSDKPKTTGGYSWTDKPAARRAVRRQPVRRQPRFDPKAPLATYPGFRMLPGGKSVVWVYVSRKVNVSVRRAAGRVTFVLAGAQVAIRNNTHPLVTHYFATPLSRAWLRPDPTGAELVLELRENVAPKHRIVDGPGATMLLQVELPRPTVSHGALPDSTPGDARKGQIVLPAPRPRR